MKSPFLVFFYRRLTGCKTSTSRIQSTHRIISVGSTASKGPICSTNNQWEMKKTPTD